MLDLTERDLSRLHKNLLDRAAFLSLNTFVQILEGPAQFAAQGQSDAGLAGAHETHNEYASHHFPASGNRRRGCRLGLPTGSGAHVWRPSVARTLSASPGYLGGAH